MKTLNALTAAIRLVEDIAGREEDPELSAWARQSARYLLIELERLHSALPPHDFRLSAIQELADDLLEMHEETGVSLDGWVAGREVVEAYHGPIKENGA